MNTNEMIHSIFLLIFSNIWTYIGALLMIATITGDAKRIVKSLSAFLKRVIVNYNEKSQTKKVNSRATWKEPK